MGTRYYVYKFINKKGEVLYVGRTTDLRKRIMFHFAAKRKEALKNEVDKILYAECECYGDSVIYEVYFIHKYESTYNIIGTEKGIGTTFSLPEKLEWKFFVKISEKIILTRKKIEEARKKLSISKRWIPLEIHKYTGCSISTIRKYFKEIGYPTSRNRTEGKLKESINMLKNHNMELTITNLSSVVNLQKVSLYKYIDFIKNHFNN